MKILMSFFKEESGATAIEYGLIAALISVVAITAMQGVGGALEDKFELISEKLNAANPS